MAENENLEKVSDHDYASQEGQTPPHQHVLGVLEVDPASIRLAPPIGGWLVLPALGLVLGPILNLVTIVEEVRLLKSPEMMQAQFRVPGLAETVLKAVRNAPNLD